MNHAIDKQAGAQIAGVNAGAGQAIGGYQRGASQARSGVEQNSQLELGAKGQIYVNLVDAAGPDSECRTRSGETSSGGIRGCGVGREISREVGQGMRIRF